MERGIKMAVKQVNLRLDETRISAAKIPYYILTTNVQELSDTENDELSAQLEELTEDDLQIVKTEEMFIRS